MLITAKKLILAATALALVLAGCGDAKPAPADKQAASATEQLYTIFFGDYPNRKTWVIDKNGETVPEDKQYTVLRDLLTGEPQCKTLSRVEAAGKDEYDNITTRDVSALFDLDGNLLYDWSECVYKDGFGDFVIRQSRWLMFYEETLPKDFESVLWNFKTGRTQLPEAGEIFSMGDGETLLLMDTVYRPLGIVDKSGNTLSGFPAPEKYAYATEAWNGYILASSRPFAAYDEDPSYRYFLLNSNFEELLSHKYLYRSYFGNVLQYVDGDGEQEQVGIIAPDGKELLRPAPGESLYYFDDGLAVIQTGEYESQTNPERRKLVRLSDGAVLAEDYEILEFAGSYEDKTPVEKFLGYKSGSVHVLGRDGKILAQKEVGGIKYLDNIPGGFIRCSTLTADGGNSDAILDMKDLREIVPPGVYSNVMQATEWTGGELIHYELLTADPITGVDRQYTRDVLDMDGNVLVSGLNDIFGVGPDRLAVRKGFEAGLMDWHGNWIVKRSVFSETLGD